MSQQGLHWWLCYQIRFCCELRDINVVAIPIVNYLCQKTVTMLLLHDAQTQACVLRFRQSQLLISSQQAVAARQQWTYWGCAQTGH